MPRERLYASNAERQSAYRARTAARTDQRWGSRVKELEAALGAAISRAEQAETRAMAAERRLETLERSLAARRRSH